jgi:hypothetical protein
LVVTFSAAGSADLSRPRRAEESIVGAVRMRPATQIR